MKRFWRIVLGLAFSISGALAGSNIDPANSVSQSSFIGAIDWRPGADLGAAINQYYCSGFLYGSQIGWINLGNSAPLDGVRFRNDAAKDFGVNVLPSGALRGFAYGANIGWVSFEEQGNPRVDWLTGRLSGSIYSANAGWISLGTGEASVRVENIGQPQDLDNDTLPDAWEISRTGSLTSLSADGDADRDGQNDRDEFLAGTDPLDRDEKLGPIVLSHESGATSLRWPSKAGYLYLLEKRASFQSGEPWISMTPAALVGAGTEMTFLFSSAQASLGFFRVRAFPPLTKLN